MVRVIAWLEVNWVEVYVEVYNNLIDMMVCHDMFFWTGMLWYARSLGRESNRINPPILACQLEDIRWMEDTTRKKLFQLFNLTCTSSDQIRLKFPLFQSVFCNGSRFHSQKSSPLFTIHQSKHVNAFAILDDSDDESPKAAAAPPAKKDTKPKTQAVSNGNKEKR